MLWKNYCTKQMLLPPLTQDRLRYTVLTIVSMFLHTQSEWEGFQVIIKSSKITPEIIEDSCTRILPISRIFILRLKVF